MKNTLTYLPFTVGFIVYLFLLSNSSGGPVQTTGAPGEASCGRSGCHAVAENTGGASVAITFDEGASEYAPGETYPMTVALTNAMNEAKNGFQLVALDAQNNNAGSWELVEEATTQIRAGNSLADRSYLTHTTAGTGQTSWMANWKAPAESIGAISFYLSVNDSNSNGGRTGDDIYITNLSINPASSTSTRAINQLSKQVTIYPNPAKDFINVISPEIAVLNTTVYDAIGNIVQTSFRQTSLNLHGLKAGIYFLKIDTVEGQLVKKILLK